MFRLTTCSSRTVTPGRPAKPLTAWKTSSGHFATSSGTRILSGFIFVFMVSSTLLNPAGSGIQALLFRSQCVEGQIQRQHVHAGLAENSEVGAFGVLSDESQDFFHSQVARFGDTRCLK